MKKPSAKALRRSAKKPTPKKAAKKKAPVLAVAAENRQLPERDMASMRPFVDLLTNWQIR